MTIEKTIGEAIEDALDKFAEEAQAPERKEAAALALERMKLVGSNTNTELPPVGTPVLQRPNYFGALTGVDERLTKVKAHWTSGDGTRTNAKTELAPHGCFYADQFFKQEDGTWVLQLV